MKKVCRVSPLDVNRVNSGKKEFLYVKPTGKIIGNWDWEANTLGLGYPLRIEH